MEFSNDCDNRQPCPGGSDDECTFGGTCWADTSCDATLGHGSQFTLQEPDDDIFFLKTPYDDPANMRFCGTWLAKAMENCSFETHCRTNDDCKQGDTCWPTTCNVQDFEEYKQIKEKLLIGAKVEGNDEVKGLGMILAENDLRRHNFCGVSWYDADRTCSTPCPGGEGE